MKIKSIAIYSLLAFPIFTNAAMAETVPILDRFLAKVVPNGLSNVSLGDLNAACGLLTKKEWAESGASGDSFGSTTPVFVSQAEAYAYAAQGPDATGAPPATVERSSLAVAAKRCADDERTRRTLENMVPR